MPDTSCLHIQDHGTGPIRVVDIPWVSVSNWPRRLLRGAADRGRPGRRSLPAVSPGQIVAYCTCGRQRQGFARRPSYHRLVPVAF